MSNFVVVAGPNGVGKTYLKNAIVHIFQNNGNPPTGSKVVLQATSNEEKETWGKNEFNLPYNTFWQLLTKKRKKLKTRTRLIQIDSNREIETIQFQEMTFSQIGDPEQDEIDYSHGLSNIKDRFQDVCRTLHRLKSRMVKDVYTSYRQNIGSQEQVTVEKLADPTAKFEELFYRILYPKKMKTIEVESRTIQFFDEDGTVRPVNVLSSGEKEAVVLAFDLTLQNPSDCIILIDEPELHLHPELTFRLLKVLKAIGDRNQFFLFTHSADIIGNSFDTGIHFIRPKSKVQGNQVIRVDRDNIGELKLIPNLKDTIGMLSLGKKLLFVEGKNISIDRNVFSTIAKSSQLDIAIIPSDGCSNINNMSLLCETLEKGVFGIELYMVRDKDSLTEEQIQNFTTKSKGKLI
ncbi:MAG: AAA family ATPase, partial [Nitrosopumilus sp.]